MFLTAIKAITNTENFGPEEKEKREEAMPTIQNSNAVYVIHVILVIIVNYIVILSVIIIDIVHIISLPCAALAEML